MFCFFWVIYLSSENDLNDFKVFLSCSIAIFLFVGLAWMYVFRKTKNIDWNSIKIAQISGKPFLELKDINDGSSAHLSIGDYYIGQQKVFLPSHWSPVFGISDKSDADSTVTSEVFLSPWGQAFPVSIGKQYNIEQEAHFPSLHIIPVDIFSNALFVVSLFLCLLAAFSLGVHKTVWIAPIDSYRLLSTQGHRQKFYSVNEAMRSSLEPYQPIYIKNVQFIPVHREASQLPEALVIDSTQGFSNRIRDAKQTIQRDFDFFSMSKNLSDIGRQYIPAQLKRRTVPTDSELIHSLQCTLTAFLQNEGRRANSGFITNDTCYPGKYLYTDEYQHPSVNEAFQAVLTYLDLLPNTRDIRGLIIPQEQKTGDENRFPFYIDRDHWTYPIFSDIFLTIFPAALIVLIAISVFKARRNAGITKRIREFYKLSRLKGFPPLSNNLK
ncbi:MAG TPA: hypothetical protein DCO75_01210 [Fibrobacteres bacterium]|nr:hypothetical protein [Fibrobacterota bacterium]